MDPPVNNPHIFLIQNMTNAIKKFYQQTCPYSKKIKDNKLPILKRKFLNHIRKRELKRYLARKTYIKEYA